VPGLQRYLEKQVDKLWEEGETAIFDGELDLELFTTEELEAGAEIFNTVMAETETDESAASADSAKALFTEKSKTLLAQLETYLVERFTPERLAQLRARLQTIMDEADYRPNTPPSSGCWPTIWPTKKRWRTRRLFF